MVETMLHRMEEKRASEQERERERGTPSRSPRSLRIVATWKRLTLS
jgi:hypothetical protein